MIKNIFSYSNLPLLFAILSLFMVIAVAVIILNLQKTKKDKEKVLYEQLMASNGIRKDKHKDSLLKKWNLFWGEKLTHGDILSKHVEDSEAGRFVIILFIVITVVFAILFRNLFMALIPSVTAVFILMFIANRNIKKKEDMFDEQIPAFLSILKSNILAGETAENALINAINSTNEPLYSELEIAKSVSQTASFESALSLLRVRTNNETLKFLCSCISIASSEGSSNLKDQIEVIEETLKEKMKLKNKLRLAVNQNKPTIYIASVLIPALFTFMYLMNEQTRAFWFKEPISWFIFAFILIVYIGGLLIINRMINNTIEGKK